MSRQGIFVEKRRKLASSQWADYLEIDADKARREGSFLSSRFNQNNVNPYKASHIKASLSEWGISGSRG